jgi:hypothetical protein
MRVLVSLNLADIMTATRPTTPPQHVYESPNQEADPTDHNQESQPSNSEPMTSTTE